MSTRKNKKPYPRPDWAKKPEPYRNPYRFALVYTFVTILFCFVLYFFAWHAGFRTALYSKARFLQELLPSLTFVGVLAAWLHARAKSKLSGTFFFILQTVPWLYGVGLLLVLQ